MKKHSISIRGHQTSYSLEEEFYEQLQLIARERNCPLARMITEIDENRPHTRNLSSALRVFILKEVMKPQ